MPSPLEELQSMDETRKKQVLVVATVIIMLIIIGVWVAYFNGIVMGPAQQATQSGSSAAATTTPATAPAPAAPSGPNVWQRIGEWFGGVARGIGRIFSQPSQYNIQPQ